MPGSVWALRPTSVEESPVQLELARALNPSVAGLEEMPRWRSLVARILQASPLILLPAAANLPAADASPAVAAVAQDERPIPLQLPRRAVVATHPDLEFPFHVIRPVLQPYAAYERQLRFPIPTKEQMQGMLQKFVDETYGTGFREFNADDFFHGHILCAYPLTAQRGPDGMFDRSQARMVGILYHTQEIPKTGVRFDKTRRSWFQRYSPTKALSPENARGLRRSDMDRMAMDAFERHGTVHSDSLRGDLAGPGYRPTGEFGVFEFAPVDPQQLPRPLKDTDNVVRLTLPGGKAIHLVVMFGYSLSDDLKPSAGFEETEDALSAIALSPLTEAERRLDRIAGLEEKVKPEPGTVIPMVDFLERYGVSLGELERAQIRSFEEQGNHEVTLAMVQGAFHLYADPGLASVADRMRDDHPVEGVAFDIADDLRTRPKTAEGFTAPGLIVSDPIIGDFTWVESPVRILPLSVEQMQSLNPVTWIALSINRNLTVEQVLNLRSITFSDEQGRTIYAIFA